MKRSRVLFFFISSFLSIFEVHAVILQSGRHFYYSESEDFLRKLDYILNPEEVVLSQLDFNPFPTNSQVLFLGDGFEEKNDSLCEKIRFQVSPSTILYRTDLACPVDKKMGNIIYQKVDHALPLPFFSNQFLTIIMRYGLCFCLRSDVSCGGVKNTEESIRMFLIEVSRILDKAQPSAFAFLHGDYFHMGKVDLSYFYSFLRSAIEFVEVLYPVVEVKLVHRLIGSNESLTRSRFKVGVTPADLESKFLGVTMNVRSEDDLSEKSETVFFY